jgi:hypothetical protein
MKKKKDGVRIFVIRHDGDESLSIELNGDHLISLNHDDDGWQGIEKACNLVNLIAEKIGAEVEHEEREEDEE